VCFNPLPPHLEDRNRCSFWNVVFSGI
jgi:hypothetical protein